jgi:NADPH-dependent 2,4-dienoyl-CoA reductase/sulfur reductase-like enzyme
MRKDIYAPDFKAQPWWWEAWTPNNALSQDPPARTQVVIVGAGYGGLSTALELRRNGIDAWCWSAACSASAPRRATAA